MNLGTNNNDNKEKKKQKKKKKKNRTEKNTVIYREMAPSALPTLRFLLIPSLDSTSHFCIAFLSLRYSVPTSHFLPLLSRPAPSLMAHGVPVTSRAVGRLTCSSHAAIRPCSPPRTLFPHFLSSHP